MKFLLMTFAFIFSVTFNLFCQFNDSTKVKQISYDQDSKSKKYILITAQQLKAKQYYDEGYGLVENNEFNKAIKPLKKAIEIDSTGNCGTGKNGMAYSELGYVFTRMSDFGNALKYLNKAIEINMLVPEPYLSKTVILMQQGKNNLAIETLNLLILNIPEYAMAYVQRGFLYNSIGNYQLALQDLKKSLKLLEDQGQKQNAKALFDDIKKQINEIEKKTK